MEENKIDSKTEKKEKNNYLKTGVDELSSNISKIFSSDSSKTWPEKVDASLSEFEDQALQNFKLQKEDEIMDWNK